jgi:anaerobic ribonucleoside-triphosphate reductase activating protein
MRAAELPINLGRCHYPVRGLGYGRRVGIWLQGCSIHCPGCVVPESWHATPQHEVSLLRLLESLLPWLTDCEGVTLSGGEPFDQPEALLAIIVALRQLIDGDILVYSGYPYRRLVARHAEILQRVDVLASEPFVASRRHDSPTLVGSTNQRVHLLTPLARRRYHNWAQFPPTVGVAVAAEAVEMAGILRPGDLTRLATALTDSGREARLTHAEI